ncbi:MAG: LptE family protein [Bacteroidales bacterium]
MRKLIMLSVLLAVVLSACSVNYSFTGASIPVEVKTINILYFTNNASLVEPTLSQKLTDAFRDKFTSETNLVLVNDGGDLILEGSITRYFTQPVSLTAEDQSALNRLSITIDVTYTDTFDDKKSFESSFTRYEDYSSTTNLASVQDQLIDEINKMLVEDVFNKAVINW